MKDINSIGFGQYCMDHSNRYGNQVIDKIALSYKVGLVTDERISPQFPGRLEEFQRGDNLQMHIGGEMIDPTVPMVISVYRILGELLPHRYFTKVVKKRLHPFYERTPDWVGFIKALDSLGFSIGQLELAFDFIENPHDHIQISNGLIRYYESSYSTDKKRKRREQKPDQKGPIRVDRHDSIFCGYNRGAKLGLSTGLGVYRVEFRIKQENKDILSIYDLSMNMAGFIAAKGSRIKARVTKFVPAGSVVIDERYVDEKLPLLPHLISI